MPLEKTGTCHSCGYENKHCICNTNNEQHGTIYNRNTSGSRRQYQNYQNYQSNDHNDYSRTAPIGRTSKEGIKLMEELLPINNELLSTYLERTEIAEDQLTKYSSNHHIYGTNRVWSCHTTSRYCFICTLCQYVNTNRNIYENLKEIIDISNIIIKITVIPNGINEMHLELITPPTSS